MRVLTACRDKSRSSRLGTAPALPAIDAAPALPAIDAAPEELPEAVGGRNSREPGPS